MANRVPADPYRGRPLDARIGDRVCRNDSRPLSEHCQLPAHFPPCCPGYCPGPDWFERAIRSD